MLLLKKTLKTFEKKLKIVHGSNKTVDIHNDNALNRLVPPISEIRTLDNAL